MNILRNPKRKDWSKVLERSTQTVDDIEETVLQIFKEVKRNGDLAIKKYTSFFDAVKLENSKVAKEEFIESKKFVSSELKSAIAIAKENIEKFHKAQKTDKIEIETSKGVICWQEKKATDGRR